MFFYFSFYFSHVLPRMGQSFVCLPLVCALGRTHTLRLICATSMSKSLINFDVSGSVLFIDMIENEEPICPFTFLSRMKHNVQLSMLLWISPAFARHKANRYSRQIFNVMSSTRHDIFFSVTLFLLFLSIFVTILS